MSEESHSNQGKGVSDGHTHTIWRKIKGNLQSNEVVWYGPVSW